METYAVSEIEDEKKIGENQFWPKIQFFGLDEKPEKYQTRDICPTQDPEVAADLDRQLDILISGSFTFILPSYASSIKWIADVRYLLECSGRVGCICY